MKKEEFNTEELKEELNMYVCIKLIKKLPSKLLDEMHMKIITTLEKMIEEIDKEKQALEGYNSCKHYIRSIGGDAELGTLVSELEQESTEKIKTLEEEFQKKSEKYKDIRITIYQELHERNYRRGILKELENEIKEESTFAAFGSFQRANKSELDRILNDMGKAELEEWDEYKKTGTVYKTMIKYKLFNEYGIE